MYIEMPRAQRCVLPGVAHHVTQRGIDKRETFSCEIDRATYLKLLKDHSAETRVRVLGWCLMTNHTHHSLAVLLRRVHGRYAQYYNARGGRGASLAESVFRVFGWADPT